MSEHNPIPELLPNMSHLNDSSKLTMFYPLLLLRNKGFPLFQPPDTGWQKLCSVNENNSKTGRNCVLRNIDQAVLEGLVLK